MNLILILLLALSLRLLVTWVRHDRFSPAPGASRTAG